MPPRSRTGDLVPVDVDGFRGDVHVRLDGRPDAPPVIMLHGFSGSLHWFDRVVPMLGAGRRLVRIDLVGHGGTGGPAVDAPVQTRVASAVLDRLGLTGVVALGHSFGADVAVGLAEWTDRVEGLVIVCQAPDYTDAIFPRGHRLMTVPALGRALASGVQRLAHVVGPLLLRRVPDAGRVLAEQGLSDFHALNAGMFKVVLGDRRARLAARPLDAQVRDAGKPTLVLLGGKDHFYGDRSRGRYESAGARVVVLPEAGHSPLVEQPDEAAAIIGDWLAETAPDAAGTRS
ncbi:MAG: alpha/beta fold hydrolase [Jatrophihabitans sp.]|uniref:alpha/beta fold hydrolase n=1 Tax=Jatrophihabitans sp. TaxID=1932789 RepID=UPI003F80778C